MRATFAWAIVMGFAAAACGADDSGGGAGGSGGGGNLGTSGAAGTPASGGHAGRVPSSGATAGAAAAAGAGGQSAPAGGAGSAGSAGAGGGSAGAASGLAGAAGGFGGTNATGNAVRRGLVAQYDFRETSGTKIRDTSGVGTPFDLELFVPEHLLRIPHGVRFTDVPHGSGENAEPNHTTPIIRSAGAAEKIDAAVRKSGAVSVEVWLEPTIASQTGPARLVSLGYTNYELTNLNIMHGPPACGDGSAGRFFQIRAGGEGNACPALAVPDQPNVTGKLQHLVFTQDKQRWTLYLDGAVSISGTLAKTPSDWNDKAGLALGNQPYLTEPGAAHGDFRFWQGNLYYVAFYDVALDPEEVKRNAAIPYEMR